MNAEQSEAAYPIVQSVFDGHTSVQTGVARLHEVLSINRSSARYFIEVYACLRRGVVFNRALSAADMSYLLQRIGDEGGEKDLSGALSALRLHNAYREQSGVSQRSNREILDRETTRLQQMRIGMATPPVSLGDVDEMFLRGGFKTEVQHPSY